MCKRLSVHPSTCSSAPQNSQCEISHFLASMGTRNLILHIHVVVNWQLSKQGIRWPVSHDRIEVTCFLNLFADKHLFPTDRRLNSKWISMQWLQVYCLKQIINLFTRALPLALAKSIYYTNLRTVIINENWPLSRVFLIRPPSTIRVKQKCGFKNVRILVDQA